MADDLLSSAGWTCLQTPPGEFSGPSDLPHRSRGWIPAVVPGTAAQAFRDAHGATAAEAVDYDADDWWFRNTFRSTGPGPWQLRLEGLATVCDVWLNGRHILASNTMFGAHVVGVDQLAKDNELVIRCAALGPLLAQRRPRPRWRTRLVRSQQLRWWRTTLLGRGVELAPHHAPVGPWRPVSLSAVPPVEVIRRRLGCRVEGSTGVVDLELTFRRRGGGRGPTAVLRVGESAVAVPVGDADEVDLAVRLEVADVALWWPHTHGAQPRYEVAVEIDGRVMVIAVVGFRTLEVDRGSGGFGLSVNGARIFCRGACWVPLDPVSLQDDPQALRGALEQLRDAGLNMLRVTGTTTYQSEAFWDLCDELGILVWQDCMLATADPPEDAAFLDDLAREVAEVLSALQGRPSLACVCGGAETEQQPSMLGLPDTAIRALEVTLPQVVSEQLPETVFVSSTPSGGDLPTHVGSGVAQYFGVGAYLRPLADVRTARVRFAAECLAFAGPPERQIVERLFGGAAKAGHHPSWKRGVPRDSGASWDFEDVRDFYVREVFGVDPMLVRYEDPERALDLGRAAVTHAMSEVMTQWRRPGSGCDGAILIALRDLVPGAGWGIVDSSGVPKSAWYALGRVLAAQALLVTDEGLDGLSVHVLNDSATSLRGTLVVELFDIRGAATATASAEVDIAPRDGTSQSLDGLLGRFLDHNHVYRFGPQVYDVLRVRLAGDTGAAGLDLTTFVAGQRRDRQDDIGLSAVARRLDGLRWRLDVSTRAAAQWVSLDVPGYLPADSWFHLAPGAQVGVDLTPLPNAGPVPRGHVRAVNSRAATSVRIDDGAPDVVVSTPAAR